MNTPKIHNVTPFSFAGFQWPRYVARMAQGPDYQATQAEEIEG